MITSDLSLSRNRTMITGAEATNSAVMVRAVKATVANKVTVHATIVVTPPTTTRIAIYESVMKAMELKKARARLIARTIAKVKARVGAKVKARATLHEEEVRQDLGGNVSSKKPVSVTDVVNSATGHVSVLMQEVSKVKAQAKVKEGHGRNHHTKGDTTASTTPTRGKANQCIRLKGNSMTSYHRLVTNHHTHRIITNHPIIHIIRIHPATLEAKAKVGVQVATTLVDMLGGPPTDHRCILKDTIACNRVPAPAPVLQAPPILTVPSTPASKCQNTYRQDQYLHSLLVFPLDGQD